MKKAFILTIFITFTLFNISFAKMEFKELDEDTIAYIDDHKISMDEINKIRKKRNKHSAGMHRRKGDSVPDSMYLKGALDTYMIIVLKIILKILMSISFW